MFRLKDIKGDNFSCKKLQPSYEYDIFYISISLDKYIIKIKNK